MRAYYNGALTHRDRRDADRDVAAYREHPMHCRSARRIVAPAITIRLIMLALATSVAGCASTPAEDPRAAAERYQTVIASPASHRPGPPHGCVASSRGIPALYPGQARHAGARCLHRRRLYDAAAGVGSGSVGRVYAQTPQPGATITKRLADQPQANIVLVPRPFEDPVPDGAPKLDLITIVLNYHDISYLPVDRAKMDKRLFDALKPGGRPGDRRSFGTRGDRHRRRQDTASHRRGRGPRRSETGGLRARRRRQFPAQSRRSPAPSRRTIPRVPTDKFALRFVKPQSN